MISLRKFLEQSCSTDIFTAILGTLIHNRDHSIIFAQISSKIHIHIGMISQFDSEIGINFDGGIFHNSE